MLPSDQVKAKARALGFELVGVCRAHPALHHAEYESWLAKGYGGTMTYLADHLALKAHPSHLLPDVKSVIAVGLNYAQPNHTEPDAPKIAKYALGRDYHKVIRAKLKRLAKELTDQHPESKFRICVDSAPIFERDYANLAGLGWFGKNTMLINSRMGSWFLIGLLLTNLEIEPDLPAIGGCGTCRKCIDACPTGAIVHEEGRWQVDARRCISYLTIEHSGEIDEVLQKQIGDWTFGCDVCQDVCPFNEPRATQPERARTTAEPDFLARREWPMLTELKQIDRASWDGLTRGSPVRRAGLEGLRRNVGINLANLIP